MINLSPKEIDKMVKDLKKLSRIHRIKTAWRVLRGKSDIWILNEDIQKALKKKQEE